MRKSPTTVSLPPLKYVVDTSVSATSPVITARTSCARMVSGDPASPALASGVRPYSSPMARRGAPLAAQGAAMPPVQSS